MRSINKVHWSRQMLLGAMFMVMVLVFGLATAFVSHAESKGKVTASSSVYIRQEASASSSAIGSAEKDATVDIKGQVTASDGTLWYQVYVNGTTLGYIRADLVQITDGSTPPTITETGTTTPDTTQTTTIPTTTTEVTAVEPISATVTNSRSVRVRAGASTTTEIVTTAQNGLALTVTGQTTDADGKVWYQVNFIADGTEVVGFIRSDYVALSGELVPVTAETPTTETSPVEDTAVVEEPEEVKDWDTQLQGSDWYLLNRVENEQIKISDLYEGVEHNKALYEDSQKTVKSQKIVIIILVILAIALAAAVSMLVFKIKDMNDSAYFSQVEKETLRRRNANKSQSGQKVMHTVGSEKKPASRPQGTKPAGGQGQVVKPQGGQAQGSRPAGAQGQTARAAGGQSQTARPVGAQGQVVRPQGGQSQTARPAGTQSQAGRPQGGQSQTARSAGAQGQVVRPQGGQSQAGRPQGGQAQTARSTGAQSQAARSTGAQSQAARSTGGQTTRPAGAQPQAAQSQGSRPGSQRPQTGPVQGQGGNGQNVGWQSKNFMTDDDEFEFEFLNWDGSEEK